VRRRLAAYSLYRKKLLEIRQLMGQQEFALAKQGTSYKLVGPRAHKTKLYELIEQAEKIGEELKPKDSSPMQRAWQRAFWGTDLRETIRLPEGKSWMIQNQSRTNGAILVDKVATKEVWFIPEMSLRRQDPQLTRGLLGQLVIGPEGGERAQGEMLGVNSNKGSSSVFLKQDLNHLQLLALWLQVSKETNPKRMAETMEFWMPERCHPEGGNCGDRPW